MAPSSSHDSGQRQTLTGLKWHVVGLYPCQQVAMEIAASQCWSQGLQKEFLAAMLAAAAAQSLITRDKRTGECRPPGFPGLWPLVTVQDVNNWLEKLDAPYRWAPSGEGDDTGDAKVDQP